MRSRHVMVCNRRKASQPFHEVCNQPLPRPAIPSTLPAICLIDPTHHSPITIDAPDLSSVPFPRPRLHLLLLLSTTPLVIGRHRGLSFMLSALHITSSSCRHAYPLSLPVPLIPFEAIEVAPMPCHPLNMGCPQSRFANGSPCSLLTVSASGRSSACLALRTLQCSRASPCAAIPLPPC